MKKLHVKLMGKQQCMDYGKKKNRGEQNMKREKRLRKRQKIKEEKGRKRVWFREGEMVDWVGHIHITWKEFQFPVKRWILLQTLNLLTPNRNQNNADSSTLHKQRRMKDDERRIQQKTMTKTNILIRNHHPLSGNLAQKLKRWVSIESLVPRDSDFGCSILKFRLCYLSQCLIQPRYGWFFLVMNLRNTDSLPVNGFSTTKQHTYAFLSPPNHLYQRSPNPNSLLKPKETQKSREEEEEAVNSRNWTNEAVKLRFSIWKDDSETRHYVLITNLQNPSSSPEIDGISHKITFFFPQNTNSDSKIGR